MKNNSTKKIFLAAGLCFIFLSAYSDVFAWGRGDRDRRYHYDRGRWHRQGWFGFDVAVTTLSVGTIVDTLPPGYTTIIVSGSPYYCYNNVYFRPYHSNGYVVVTRPVVPAVVAPVAPQQTNPNYLPLTKIAEMANQDLPDSVIIQEIQRTGSTYSLNAEIISYLKKNKVGDQVIDYMMQTGSK